MSASYAELTFCDPNPIKRLLQRSRLSHAIRLAQMTPSPRVILDFGAGNGELCKLLRMTYPQMRIVCYEPTPALLQEAKQNLRHVQGVEFLSTLETIDPHSIDLAFCLEVFEHLPLKETVDALNEMTRMLSNVGHLVVGVPVEIGLPALYKGLFRMSRRYGSFDARLGNVLKCVIGRPPKRVVGAIGEGRGYYFSHAGFDHRNFQSVLSEYFAIKATAGAPIRTLGTVVNPELYFLAAPHSELRPLS
jgi:SAM-dependent methyltransferase